jgi:hypothetical protein
MKKEAYVELIKLTKIGSRAVKKAQEENRQKGLPSVYSKNKNLLRTSRRNYDNEKPLA